MKNKNNFAMSSTAIVFVANVTIASDQPEIKTNGMNPYTVTISTSSLISEIGNSCAALLKPGAIYDKSSYLSTRNRISQYIDWACSSDFKSSKQMRDSSLELGIPIEGLPQPLTFNLEDNESAFQESLSQWCSLVYSHLEDETLNQQFSQKINHGVIGAVGKCIEAEKDIVLKKTGAFISATPQNQYLNSYGVTLTMRPPLPNEKNKILSIEPKEVSCEIAGTPITATPNNPYIVKTNEVVMTCYKNGATPAQIAINTYPTNSTPWIVLPGTRDDSELTEIRQRQQALFQTIRNIRSLGDQRWTALANWSAQPQTVISGSRGSGMVSCPNGYYVAAIQVIDTDNGKACVECISVFKAECRPLNVK